MSESQVNYGSLGQGNTSYAVYTDYFDPTLLNPMPRAQLRERFNITGREFIGWDVWHCYESTFLLDSGLPVSGTLKFKYPASSPFMVESKSMKLYLNSFDMCKMGATLDEAKAEYVRQIIGDVKRAIEDDVEAYFFDSQEWEDGYSEYQSNILSDCYNIANYAPIYNTTFTDFKGERSHITTTEQSYVDGLWGCYYTNVLRSRCRHTKQKDTGTAVIWQDSMTNMVVDPLSFLRQVVGLREVNEFHELCCEKLFLDVKNKINPEDQLTIALLYSRRGSLDINPIRTTDIERVPRELLDVTTLTMKTQGQ